MLAVDEVLVGRVDLEDDAGDGGQDAGRQDDEHGGDVQLRLLHPGQV